jgi:ABC-2 type transport system ATP-binding protein
MLEVRDVLKRYDDKTAVDRVSFEVRPGEIFALLGPNGAGKTTLIRMITDILKPDEGRITLDGRPVEEVKDRISYLPEERGVYRRSKVMEGIAYYGELKGLARADARAEALALLAEVELAEWADKQIQTLSKGMQQKIQLCNALIGSPRLLILDEPFSGLDPINTQMLERILADRRGRGTTILLSTHQMNKVEQLCDRALMISHGHRVLYGAIRDIRREHTDHAVLVTSEREPARVAGVTSVERFGGEHGWKLHLEPDATTRGVLGALLATGLEIEAWSLSSLPLEDIFIQVAGESAPRATDVPVPVGGAR